MATNIDKIQELKDKNDPIYCKYHSQYQPQEAYIQMDENGTISADYSSIVGDGMPSDVWHLRTIRFPITPNVTGSTILDFVTGYRDEFERIHEGHSVEWDGNNNKGYLTDVARDAYDDVCLALRNIQPDFSAYDDAEEWYYNENFSSGTWVEALRDGTLKAKIEEDMKHTDSDVYLAFSVDDAVEYFEKRIRESMEE